ncbi:MAG: MarR family winged helix-turn-helix transcriptional regulator [Leptolyngbyaceae cyanobacterium]
MSNLPPELLLKSVVTELSKFDSRTVMLSFNLLQVSTQLIKQYEAFFKHYDLSSGKFTVLLALHQCPTLTPTECAQAVEVTGGTISGLLNGLERQKLIVRSQHPNDGRMNAICLSEAGQTLMSDLVPAYLNWTTALMAELDKTEKIVLNRLLRKLVVVE